MPSLFLDEEIFNDPTKWTENKDTFVSAVKKYIEDNYKSEDSEQMYKLFNPVQIQVMQNYFRGYSVEMYKELNGTVDMQIEKRKAQIKTKVGKIEDAMGNIDVKDWIYDGMVDSGKNGSLKCDLCPRPVRYAHFAVNKKTKECLRFGCNCAADFFHMEKGSINSLRSIQAKTLIDIKIIACILEKMFYKEYLTYMCGYVGKLILEEGSSGLKGIMTYMLPWDKKDDLITIGDTCVITYGDNTKEVKEIDWIKQNIVYCLNGDLTTNIYDGIKSREIVKVNCSDEDKVKENTAPYVKFAMQFIERQLPIPLSLATKLNSIISNTTKKHHPDYLKYVQELLISRNLEDSAILKKAFSEFIINYLASSMGIETRDLELVTWGIRGQKTFYNTVLVWENSIIKLKVIKEINYMIKNGLISVDELDRTVRRSIGYSDIDIMGYTKKCIDLLLNKKEIIIDKENIKQGYSKYQVKDLDLKIGIDLAKTKTGYKTVKKYSNDFNVDTIPLNIGLMYKIMGILYRDIIKGSMAKYIQFIKLGLKTETIEELVKYFSCIIENKDKTNHVHLTSSFVNIHRDVDKTNIQNTLKMSSISNEKAIEIANEYKDELTLYKMDSERLLKEMLIIYENLEDDAIDMYKMVSNKPEEDYDKLVVQKKKSNKDYFMDYCNLLIAKRSTKKLQEKVNRNNITSLTIFKELSKYEKLLELIQDIPENDLKLRLEELDKKIIQEMGIIKFKEDLESLTNKDITEFKSLLAEKISDDKKIEEIYKELKEINKNFNKVNSLLEYYKLVEEKDNGLLEKIEKKLIRSINHMYSDMQHCHGTSGNYESKDILNIIKYASLFTKNKELLEQQDSNKDKDKKEDLIKEIEESIIEHKSPSKSKAWYGKVMKKENMTGIVNRFTNEINMNIGKGTPISKKSIQIASKKVKTKSDYEYLRDECNRVELIINKTQSLRTILENLEKVDLSKLSLEILIEIDGLIGKYYILKSEGEKISNIIKNAKSKEKIIDEKERMKLVNLLIKQKEYNNLDELIKKITESVIKYKKCSDKQFKYIEKGLNKLGIKY